MIILLLVSITYSHPALICQNCTSVITNCESCVSFPRLLSTCIQFCPSGYLPLDSNCIKSESLLLDFNFLSSSISNFQETWTFTHSPWPWIPKSLPSRGQYLPSETSMRTFSSFSLFQEFSLFLWTRLLGLGSVIQTSSFRVVSTEDLFILHAKSQSSLNCRVQVNELRLEKQSGWNLIVLMMWKSGDDLIFSVNGKKLSVESQYFYYFNEFIVLGGSEAFMAYLSLSNDLQVNNQELVLSSCLFGEYEVKEKCVACEAVSQSEECKSFKLSRRVQRTYTLSYFTLSNCPSLYKAENSTCIETEPSNLLVSFHKPFAQNFFDSILTFTAVSKMQNAYMRGLYFDGSTGKLQGSYFQMSMNFTMHLFVMPQKLEGSIFRKSASKVVFSLDLTNDGMKITISGNTVTLKGNMTIDAWNSLYISSVPESQSSSTYLVFINKTQTDTLSEAPILDSNNTDLFISADSLFKGFIFEFSYSVSGRSQDLLIKSSCSSCSFCPYSIDDCLYECKLDEYFSETCQKCSSSCTSCIRNTSCSLNTDILCENYTEYNYCDNCKQYADSISNDPCKCGTNLKSYDKKEWCCNEFCVTCDSDQAFCDIYYPESFKYKELYLPACPSLTENSNGSSCEISDGDSRVLFDFEVTGYYVNDTSKTPIEDYWIYSDEIILNPFIRYNEVLPGKGRGLYLNSKSMRIDFTMAPVYTMIIWVKTLKHGIFLYYEESPFYFNLSKNSTEMSFPAVPEVLNFKSLSAVKLDDWAMVYISINVEKKFSIVRLGINKEMTNIFSSQVKSYAIFRSTTLRLNSPIENSKFNGWVKEISYYLSYIQFSFFSSSFSSSLNKLNDCGPYEYLSDDGSCNSCKSSCATCIDNESCLVCADKSCYQCYDFYTTDCKRCNDGQAFDETIKICADCPEVCETCWRLRPDRCFQCSEGYFKSFENLCIKNCPTGFQVNFKKCVKEKDGLDMVWFKFTRVMDPIVDLVQGIYLRLGINDLYQPEMINNEPRFLTYRGIFFNDSTFATLESDRGEGGSLVFGNNHFIQIWILVQRANENFVFKSNYLNTMVISVELGFQFSISYDMDEFLTSNKRGNLNSLSSSTQEYNTWVQLTSSFIYSNSTSTIKLSINSKVDTQNSFQNHYLKEDFPGIFTFGNEENSFTGYLFSFKLQLPSSSSESRDLSSCACPKCTDTNDCLISCGPSEYLDDSKCKSCDSSCIFGCIRSENCVLHPDALCSTFEYLEKGRCLSCVTLAEDLSSCSCVENSEPLSNFSSCVCRSGYEAVGNTCRRCFDWVLEANSSYLSSFESIFFDFERSVGNNDLTCDEIFEDLSLLKFGKGYSCYFINSRKGLVLDLGNDASFVFGEIFFRMGVLYHQEAICGSSASPFSSILSNTSSTPGTRAVLLAPSVVFFECEDLFLDGSQSSGSFKRPLEYRWTFSSSPSNPLLSFYSSSFQLSSSLLIEKSSLTTSNISATLEVRNVFGGLSSATTFIQSVFVQDLLLLYYDQKIATHFLPTVDNYYDFFARRCDPALEVEIKWRLVQVNQNLSQVNQEQLLNSQKRNGQLVIPANSFFPHSQVEFEVFIKENNTVLAQASLKLTALETRPLVVVDIANGTLPVHRDLKISVKLEFDLQVEDYFEVFWTCLGSCPDFSSEKFDLLLNGKDLQKFQSFQFQLAYKDQVIQNYGVLRTLDFFTSESFLPIVNIFQVGTGLQPGVVSPEKDFALDSSFNPVPENFSLNWSLSSKDLTSSVYLGQNSFITVSPQMMVPGSSYRIDLRVQYHDENSTEGLYYYEFLVNLPPTIEKIDVSPNFGLEFFTIFQISAVNARDPDLNYPLKYVFGYVKNEMEVYLNLKNVSWTFWTQLPFTGGKTLVFVTAFDALGDQGSESTSCFVGLNLEFDSFLYFEQVKKIYQNVFFDFQTTVGMVSLLSEGVLNRQLTVSGKFMKVLQEYQELLQDCFDFCISGFNEMTKNILKFDFQASQAVSVALNLLSLNPNLEKISNFYSISKFIEVFLEGFEDSSGFSSNELKNLLNSDFNLAPLNNSLMVEKPEVFNEAIKINNKATSQYLRQVPPGKRVSIKLNSGEHQVLGSKTEKTLNLTIKSQKYQSKVKFSQNLQNFLNISDIFISFLTISQEKFSNYFKNSEKFKSFVVDVSVYSNFSYFPVISDEEFVEITIPVMNLEKEDEVECKYLDQSTLTWESSGCKRVSIKNSSVVCSCSHLSAFMVFLEGSKKTAENTNVEQVYKVNKFNKINSINASGVYFCTSIILVYLIAAYYAYRQDMREMNLTVPLDIAFCKTERSEKNPQKFDSPKANVSLNEDQVKDDEIIENETNQVNQNYDESLKKKESFIDKFLKENSKSYKELMKSSHELFRLIFRPSINETRIMLLTLFYLKILVQVFLIGLFYKDADSKKENIGHKTIKEALIKYSKEDFWILVYSTVISLIFIKIPEILLVFSDKNSHLYPFSFRNLPRKLKIQRVAGYLLCFGFIVFCGISISLFSINFSQGIKNIWIVSTILTVFQDIFITSVVKSLLIIFIKKMIRRMIVKYRLRKEHKATEIDNE